MKPMTPMTPMTPMKPMEPMAKQPAWWPKDFGEPCSSGSQNGFRYAFFASRRRLVIDRDGTVTTFDTGEYLINGASQAGGAHGPSFSTDAGPVDLDQLERIDSGR